MFRICINFITFFLFENVKILRYSSVPKIRTRANCTFDGIQKSQTTLVSFVQYSFKGSRPLELYFNEWLSDIIWCLVPTM